MAKKYTTLLLLASALSVSSSLALANDYGNNAQIAVNTGNIVGSVDNLIAGYGKNWKDKYLFIDTPFKNESVKLNNIQTNGTIRQADKTIYVTNITKETKQGDKERFIIEPKVKALKENDFLNMQPTDQALFFMLNLTNESASSLVNMLMMESCIPDVPQGIVNILLPGDKNKKLCNVTASSVPNYSLNSLLGPTSYADKEQSETAKRFIKYASYITIPLDIPPLEELEAAKDVGKKYLIFLRTSIAAQSAGLSNLYQMYLARKVVPDLGTKAGIGKNNASPLEVEQFAATRRLNSEIKANVVTFDADGKKTSVSRNWHESMEKASPAQVQREMVYLLAEMRYEMFQQRLATERLTALMSLIQIEQNRQALSIENTTFKSQYEQAKYAAKGTAVNSGSESGGAVTPPLSDKEKAEIERRQK